MFRSNLAEQTPAFETVYRATVTITVDVIFPAPTDADGLTHADMGEAAVRKVLTFLPPVLTERAIIEAERGTRHGIIEPRFLDRPGFEADLPSVTNGYSNDRVQTQEVPT